MIMPRQFRMFLAFGLVAFFIIFTSAVSFAQTPSDKDPIKAPDFTAASLETDMKNIDARDGLSEEQKSEINTLLGKAAENLEKTAQNIGIKNRFEAEITNASVTLRELEENTDKAQAELLGENGFGSGETSGEV